MGKRKCNNDKPTTIPAIQKLTLREENHGRKCSSVSSMLKLEHLQKLAIWASGETLIPSLAALLGQRLAATAELVGLPLERALFMCQRCETVLRPGDNCSIRIESNHSNLKRKNLRIPQNNIIYTCHFCSYHNFVRGTARGCVKELLHSRVKRFSGMEEASTEESTAAETHVQVNGKGNSTTLGTPVTPGSLSTRKKKKRFGTEFCVADNSREISAGLDVSKVSCGSSKRKRRQWSSLKDIAEKTENANQVDISNLVIPLKL